MGDCNIRVICRFRPINNKEKEEWSGKEVKQIIRFSGREGVEVNLPGQSSQSYSFDFVFPPDATQEDIYNQAAKLAVQDVLEGFNGTIFAYGQTGSGKSHSMMGPEGSLMNVPEQRGIIPRACCHIFEFINSSTDEDIEYSIKCSYLEIYNEMIMDLLNPDKQQSLKVHESPSKGVWIAGLTEEFGACDQDVLDLLAIGGSNRAISSTSMNKVSSRSHSCFIISVEQKTKDGSTKTGKLNLVDLAGSEKVGKTGATGQTLEEAKKINQSLSALGNCIHSLTDSKKNKHVPYRDSKLTHVLKESLGGNTKTCMLIACSPHEYNIEETISTLKFGQRAKTIKNNVKVNKQLSAAELQARLEAVTAQLTSLQKYVVSLEANIAFMKSPDYVPGKPLPNASEAPTGAEDANGEASEDGEPQTAESFSTLALADAQVELQKLKEATAIKIDDLTQELQFLKEQIDVAQREAETKQDELSLLRSQVQSIRMELETEKTQRDLEAKRAAFQESETGFVLEQQLANINELAQAKEELESNLASIENERRQLQEAIAQLERKVRQMGDGGSSAEMDEYIAGLEDQINRLSKEKTQLEATGGNSQKVEELEAQLREATTKATLLQGQCDEAEARATADQETILDELNIAAEKEGELSQKAKQLEEELRKVKSLAQEQQAQSILSQKQIVLLEESVKAFKAGGAILPEQLDDAVTRVNGLLQEIAQEHMVQIKDLEAAHHASTHALQQQMSTLLTEKQMAERKVKEQEAQFNLNQTKTVSENKALKQQLEGAQEEYKRIKQKLLLLTQTGTRASVLSMSQGGDAGEQVRSLESEIQKYQNKLDTATRQLTAEIFKSQLATKRIDQQSQRLHDLEEQVSKKVKENAKLAQEAGEGQKALEDLEELKKLTEQLKIEIEQLKLHPRSKIFRPLKSGGGLLGAFRERIDFTTIALKSTGSKFLEDARAEATRAELLSKELR